MIMAFNMTQSYFPFSVLNTGIAVAAAFCAYESPAVTLPTELAFGVTADICTYVFCYCCYSVLLLQLQSCSARYRMG